MKNFEDIMVNKSISEKTIVQEAYLNVVRIEATLPNGNEVSRVLVRHTGAAVIVPITEQGKFLLVTQYRLPLDKNLTEFPAGGIEDNEDWEVTAQRELREETGFAAREIIQMGHIYPAPGFCDEVQYLFLAKGLYESPLEADADEEFELCELTADEIEIKIASGELSDAKTIAAFVRAKHYLKGV